MPPKISYCAELTRTYDRNRYLCCLFAPADIREAWFALYAFQHEISTIADKIGEEMVGFIRYAWWRETVNGIFAGKPPAGHPVAEALVSVVKRYELPEQLFDRIIDAHETAMAEKQELDEAFLAATSGSLMQLYGLVVSFPAVNPAYTEMTNSLGIGWGAIETASLPHMDAPHRGHFVDLARQRLVQARDWQSLKPFARTVEFFLRRMEKGTFGTSSAIMLPFTLWRLSKR